MLWHPVLRQASQGCPPPVAFSGALPSQKLQASFQGDHLLPLSQYTVDNENLLKPTLLLYPRNLLSHRAISSYKSMHGSMHSSLHLNPDYPTTHKNPVGTSAAGFAHAYQQASIRLSTTFTMVYKSNAQGRLAGKHKPIFTHLGKWRACNLPEMPLISQ